MIAEFDWWLLILGLVVGAGLVWLVLADSGRHEWELDEAELPVESAWISRQLDAADLPADAETVQAVLREHRAYRRMPPPDIEP